MSLPGPECRACGSPSSCAILQPSQAPYAVYRCAVCDYAFVFPLPSAAALTGAYDQDDYYADWVGAQAARREKMWRRRARRVLEALPCGELLDVGCGEGSFLNASRRLGWRVKGTEISVTACQLAKSQWQLDVFCGELKAARLPSDSFDVVTLWHVIEHVPDPKATLREAARLTRPGGRVIIACPNRHARLFNAAYRIGRGRAPHLFDPADRELHLSHFTAASLRRLLESCGLRIIRLDVDRGHVQRIKYALDLIATAWYRATGILWSEAMEFWARKPFSR